MTQVIDVPIESISNDLSLDTTDNWDSVNHMNLVLALEQASASISNLINN